MSGVPMPVVIFCFWILGGFVVLGVALLLNKVIVLITIDPLDWVAYYVFFTFFVLAVIVILYAFGIVGPEHISETKETIRLTGSHLAPITP